MKQEEAEKSGGQVAPGDVQLHPAPSMLWFLIPVALIVIFAIATR